MSDEKKPEETADAAKKSRKSRFSEAFKAFIPQDWAPYPAAPSRLASADWTQARREKLSQLFPHDRLVIPAGGLRTRVNDTDYLYRPDSNFAYLTGLGTDREADAVVVMEPTSSGHDTTLYFKPRAPRTDPEFYESARYGEMWVGNRESLAEMATMVGFGCAPNVELAAALAKDCHRVNIRIIRETDAELTALVDALRRKGCTHQDQELAAGLAELRLYKDEYEIAELRNAQVATLSAFEDLVRNIPRAVRQGRGERWLEGIFNANARHLGNDVGYATIVAAGDHACALHWVRNDGDLVEGDLVLIDAGIELDSLYTADITRTFPINGSFTPEQRKVYEVVLEAQQAAIAVCKPGAKWQELHKAATGVIARHLEEWGLLPVSAEQTLDKDNGGEYRRWMVHGTSHHMGLDVHDCNALPAQRYQDLTLEPGMVFTIEPGMYFKQTDLLAPEELRGIGVRIEDNIVITETGYENLSAAFPHTVEEVEAWMAPLLADGKETATN